MTTKRILELLDKDSQLTASKITATLVEQTICNQLSTLGDKASAVKHANSTQTNEKAEQQLKDCKKTIYDILQSCLTPPNSNPFSANLPK